MGWNDQYKRYIESKYEYIDLNREVQIGGTVRTIDFDKLKRIRELGSGARGTTYLVEFEGVQYAQKIQHILEEELVEDYGNEIWREMDLYRYIDQMSDDDQIFFTHLHAYRIYNGCTYVQNKRLYNDANILKAKFDAIAASDWCITYLMDYKGINTLATFSRTPTDMNLNTACSFALQMCKIIDILYIGGYSHNDFFPGNIMVSRTKVGYFEFMGHHVPYNGYQLTAIDYGFVIHKKFLNNVKPTDPNYGFFVDPERWCFRETFQRVLMIFERMSKIMNLYKKPTEDTSRGKNSFSVDHAIRQILIRHPDFYKMVRGKYVEKFPKGKKLLDEVVHQIKTKGKNRIHDFVQKKSIIGSDDAASFRDILERIVEEFKISFPKKYAENRNWDDWDENIVPKDTMLKLLRITDRNRMINFLIDLMV